MTHVDILDPMSADAMSAFTDARVDSVQVEPRLVPPEAVRAPGAYERLRNTADKDRFRSALLERLAGACRAEWDEGTARRVRDGFLLLVRRLERDGVAAFTDVVSTARFRELDGIYARIMEELASSCLLHDYVNLRNLPGFLSDSRVNPPFLHPLFLALMAYRIGGPIRIVDARAKDAGPISAQAQDNMLHIDDVPFRDEYKVFVCWQKGSCAGPAGQNFVYLPGTNRLARDCEMTDTGAAFSTENASVFITSQAVECLFRAQQSVLGSEGPIAVELSHHRPTTIVFQAGALVHQRYRTVEGNARSAIFVAFQGVGSANTYGTSTGAAEGATDLTRFVLGHAPATDAETFISAIAREAGTIGTAILEVAGAADRDPERRMRVIADPPRMAAQSFERWRTSLTEAPKIEEIKLRQLRRISGDDLADPLRFLPILMAFDKHGPLDLCLYEDGREKIRKWARNRIREMPAGHLRERIAHWSDACAGIRSDDALPPEEIAAIVGDLLDRLGNHPPDHGPVFQAGITELILPEFAVISLVQLMRDLREAVVRSYSLQNFLSTSLFLFWASDEIMGLYGHPPHAIQVLGARLLRNYVATAVLVDQCQRSEFRNDGGPPRR